MTFERIEAKLHERGDIIGEFWLPNATEPDHIAHGILTWNQASGGRLRLIGPLIGWPRGVGGPLAIWGRTVDGEDLTLLDAFVSLQPMTPTHLEFYTSELALGVHASEADTWERLIVRTANLHEWLAETGLAAPVREHDERFRTTKLTVSWELPEQRHFQLPSGAMTLSPTMSTKWAYAPDWKIETDLEAVCEPDAAATIDGLYRQFISPLLSFTVFASNRPDSVLREIVLDPASDRRAAIWRRGDKSQPRPWAPDEGYLFSADDLPDMQAGIHKWFEIFDATFPSLGSFSETINNDLFEPGRLIVVATALQAYGTRWHNYKGGMLNVYKQLRDYAGLPEDITGSSPRNLKMLVASRNFYAHYSDVLHGFTVEQVQRELLETTRRGTALMQACLLKDLGFDTQASETRLRKHYANWPIPG